MKTLRAFVAVCAIAALPMNGALSESAPSLYAPADPVPGEEYTPQSGQAGKDVVWVPTPQELVDRMLDMAKVTPDDYLVDLGSGDGRMVITAAKRGVRAHGIEYNPDLVELSQRLAHEEGVAETGTFVQGDIFESDFSSASVVTLFLLPSLNIRLRPILLEMKPGTRVVSNSFDMEEWEPDERADAGEDCFSFCDALMWVVPARVDGSWRLGDGELKLTQTYQMLSGTLTRGGEALPISDAKMNGTEVTFTAGGQRYTGEVSGETMNGRIEGGEAWSATRSAS